MIIKLFLQINLSNILMSILNKLLNGDIKYTFNCFSCQKQKIYNYNDLNKMIIYCNKWDIVDVYDNNISGYCHKCKIKSRNSLINKLRILNKKLKLDNDKLKKDNDLTKLSKKLFKKIEIKLSDKDFLKSIFNDTTKPPNINWDTIHYILRHAHNFSQDEINKMTDIQKMAYV